MGLGAGLGMRGRRAGGRARRAHHHRRQHHHRRRRNRHHGVHARHHATNHHGVSHGRALYGGLSLFSAFTHRANGRHTTTTTANVTVSTSPENSRGEFRAPRWFGSLVVTLVLLTLIIVPFAVPAVPFPIGITFSVFFFLIIILPLIVNVVQTLKARRNTEPDPEAPTVAEEGPTGPAVPEGQPNGAASAAFATTGIVFWQGVPQPGVGASGVGASGMNGAQPYTGYAHDDPPPSFTEATATSPTSPSIMVELRGDTLQGPPLEAAAYPPTTRPDGAAAGPQAYPPGEALYGATGVEPPPPSYEEAMANGAPPESS